MGALQDGLKLFQKSEFAAAATNFETAASTQTDPPLKSHAYAWLARAYLHLHKVPEASAAAQKALDYGRDLGNAQTAMAEVYFRKGELPESEQLLVPLIKSHSGTARSDLVLAKIYRALGNYKSAHQLLEIAHNLDKKDPDIERAWYSSMNREERLADLKKRLNEGAFEDEEERIHLAASLAMMEDQQKNERRSCKLVSKVSQTETKLLALLDGPRRLRGFGVSVKLNGTPSTLLLDSGSGGILVSSKVAEKAGLSRIVDTAIGGIGDKGAASGYLAFAEKLAVGDLQFENCYVEVVDKKRSLNEDGLIGTNVFQSYLVDIDFPNSKLRLSQLPAYPDEPAEQPSLDHTANPHLHNRWIPPEFAKYEKVYRFGHMLLLPARLNNAPDRLFLLDTGAFDDTVTPAAAREAVKISTDSNIHVKGLSGEVKTVYTTGNLLFTFGHFQQRRDMVAFDMPGISNSLGTEVSGALGFGMLDLLEIKLDYRDHLVDFEYDASRTH